MSTVPFKAPTMTGQGHNAGRAVAHMFVRGLPAKNSNGQFYTDGTTIWSYGPHLANRHAARGRSGLAEH